MQRVSGSLSGFVQDLHKGAVAVVLGFRQLIRQLTTMGAKVPGAGLCVDAGSRRCSVVLMGRQKRVQDYCQCQLSGLEGL